MSVCQRKTGGWLVKFKDPSTGKWKQRQFKTRELAERFDAEAAYDAQKDQPLTLREAVLAYLQNHDLCERRVQFYSYLVNGGKRKEGAAEHLADRTVESLTRADMESVRGRLSDVSLSTANIELSMLKSVLNWCASEDLIAANPWAKYRNPPIKGPAKHHSGTKEELLAVYAKLPEWGRWAVRTVFALCLRPGKELCNLKWDAFVWAEHAARVFMPKVNSVKTVFVPDWYYSEAVQRYAVRKSDFVCTGLHGRMLSYESFKEAWRNAREKVGVSIPPYAIRHIVASEMLSNGADLVSVSAQLGHSKPDTTASYYLHALSGAQRRAAGVLVSFGEKSKVKIK